MRRHASPLLAIIALATIAVALVYGDTVEYGFVWDDYHFVRPHTWADVRLAWHGSWDATGIEAAFYRPLTTAFTAARFEVFGFNTIAYRALTLALFAFSAFATASFVWIVTRRPWPVVVATVWFVAYPPFAAAAVAWITNQFHLLELAVVVTALVWWWICRDRSARWWLPLVALQIVAMLTKEDGIMLGPAVGVIHLLYGALLAPKFRFPPWTWTLATLATLAAFLFARQAALGGIGGYGIPGWPRMKENYTRGVNYVFMFGFGWDPVPQALARVKTAVGVIGLAAILWKRDRALTFLALSGIAIALLFDLPFALVSKPEQYHLIALGACLTMSAAAAGLVCATRPRWLASAFGAGVLAFAWPMAHIVALETAVFAPCGTHTLSTNADVKNWAAVPLEIRDALPTTPDGCRLRSANSSELPMIAFGLWDREVDGRRQPFRWTTGEMQYFVQPSTPALLIPMRASLGRLNGAPARVRVEAAGRTLADVELGDERWHCQRVELPPVHLGGLSRMRRIDIAVTPTWRPSDVIPGSTDTRALGVQFAPINVGCPE